VAEAFEVTATGWVPGTRPVVGRERTLSGALDEARPARLFVIAADLAERDRVTTALTRP